MPAVLQTRSGARFLLLFAAIVLCSIGRANHAQPTSDLAMYEATARFELRGGDDAAPRNSLSTFQSLRPLLNYHMKGRPALEQLALDLNLSRGLPRTVEGELTTDGQMSLRTMLERLENGVEVKLEVDGSQVQLVAVKVRHPERELAVRIANQLVDNYVRLVRTANDDRLLNQKKFNSSETERNERKRNDLETNLDRMRTQWSPLIVSKDDRFPDAAAIEGAVVKLNQLVARPQRIKQRLSRLHELMNDRPMSDLIVLEILNLEEQLHEATQMAAKAEASKEPIEALQRDQVKMRQEYGRMSAMLVQTERDLAHWREKLRDIQVDLTLLVGEQGMTFHFTERADIALPVK